MWENIWRLTGLVLIVGCAIVAFDSSENAGARAVAVGGAVFVFVWWESVETRKRDEFMLERLTTKIEAVAEMAARIERHQHDPDD